MRCVAFLFTRHCVVATDGLSQTKHEELPYLVCFNCMENKWLVWMVISTRSTSRLHHFLFFISSPSFPHQSSPVHQLGGGSLTVTLAQAIALSVASYISPQVGQIPYNCICVSVASKVFRVNLFSPEHQSLHFVKLQKSCCVSSNTWTAKSFMFCQYLCLGETERDRKRKAWGIWLQSMELEVDMNIRVLFP